MTDVQGGSDKEQQARFASPVASQCDSLQWVTGLSVVVHSSLACQACARGPDFSTALHCCRVLQWPWDIHLLFIFMVLCTWAAAQMLASPQRKEAGAGFRCEPARGGTERTHNVQSHSSKLQTCSTGCCLFGGLLSYSCALFLCYSLLEEYQKGSFWHSLCGIPLF